MLLSLACVLVMKVAKRKLNITTVKVESVKPSDKEISGYFVAYLLPLIGGGQYFTNWPVFWFFTSMFLIFVFFSKSFYANPILSLFGYRFHEIQLTTGVSALLLTGRKIYSSADIDKVVYLTDYTVLDINK